MGAGHQDADGVYDCCRELMAAKSLPEVMEVWTTHAPRQLNAMSSWTGELWTLYWKVAANAANGPAPRPNKTGPVRRSSSPKKASVREPTARSVFSEFNLRTRGYAMNRVNRSLSPGDLDYPICICVRDMRLATVEP